MDDCGQSEGATPQKFTGSAKVFKRPAGKRTSALARFWPRASIDDNSGVETLEFNAR